MLSRYTFRGRRSRRRRTSDPANFYVDRLGTGVWTVLAVVLFFQVLDALLTLRILDRGGSELNPLMAGLIERSEPLFVGTKIGISLVGLMVLGIHKNFLVARTGLVLLLALFGGVIGWHFFLALHVG